MVNHQVYQPIGVSVNTLVNIRPIYRPILDRVSTNVSTDISASHKTHGFGLFCISVTTSSKNSSSYTSLGQWKSLLNIQEWHKEFQSTTTIEKRKYTAFLSSRSTIKKVYNIITKLPCRQEGDITYLFITLFTVHATDHGILIILAALQTKFIRLAAKLYNKYLNW